MSSYTQLATDFSGRLRWPSHTYGRRVLLIGTIASALLLLIISLYPNTDIMPTDWQVSSWRVPKLENALDPVDRIPLPDIPLSRAFHHLLPIVTSTRADRRVYDRLVWDYKYGNKTQECGHWQGAYTAMHRKILQDVAAGREDAGKIIVADGPYGFADKSVGFVSSFIVALLLGRAWTSSSYSSVTIDPAVDNVINKMPDIRYGFDSPNINWARTEPPPPDSGMFHALNVPMEYIAKTYVESSVADLDAVSPTKFSRAIMNRGFAVRMLSDYRYFSGERLRQLGLTKENVYGCILNYLLRPLPATLDILAQYHGVLAHPSVFTVAIQLRLGDAFMRDTSGELQTNLHDWDYAFECAARISEKYSNSAHRHLVFSVQSDYSPMSQQAYDDVSFFLKNWTHPTMGPPHVFTTDVKPHHIDDDQDFSGPKQNNETENELGLQATVIDNYVLDSARYRLATKDSGFAIISGLRSWSTHGPSTLYLDRSMDCGAEEQFMSLEWLAMYDNKSA